MPAPDEAACPAGVLDDAAVGDEPGRDTVRVEPAGAVLAEQEACLGGDVRTEAVAPTAVTYVQGEDDGRPVCGSIRWWYRGRRAASAWWRCRSSRCRRTRAVTAPPLGIAT